MGKLTAERVKSIRKRGLHGDGGTLYLAVVKGGSKSWVQRVTIDGKRRDIGLGGFPYVGPAAARRKAMENRMAIAAGRNPIAEKRRSSIPSFAVAARRTHAMLKPRWRNEKHADSWMQTLERHAFPTLDRIERADVLAVLIPIWGTRPETARRVRQRIRAVLSWAWAHGFITENVAGEAMNVEDSDVKAIEQSLKEAPPAEFDVARQVRVFDAYLQYVELRLTGAAIQQRRLAIPPSIQKLGGVKDLEGRLRTTFDLLEKGDQLSSRRLENCLNQIRKDLTRSLGKDHGRVVLKAAKPILEERLATFRDELNAHQEKGIARPARCVAQTDCGLFCADRGLKSA